MSRYITCAAPQGTPQWFIDRLGKVTGSKADCVTAKSRDGKSEGVTRANYRMDLVLERLTEKPAAPTFVENEAILWGKEQEPFSRMAFELQTGLTIAESGFVYLPAIAAGTSVDGFLIEDGRFGFWESKSPKSKNHYAYLRGGVVPTEYVPQVIHTFWVTGAEFCYFQSFDPRMPAKLQTFLKRVERAEVEKQIEAHERAVLQFLMEVDAEEHQMRLLAA